ncbi:MAG: ester cyclase [Acidobacteriota bacterium]|nr:ester cyclase [Acidobacteriota bacterium]
MSEENKARINRFIEEVLNNKNLAAADEIVPDNFVELDPLPGQQPGREGLKQLLAVFFAAFPDYRWTTEEQIAEGDKVVTRFTWRGTHQGNFMGIPPTGRQVIVKGVVIDRVVDGEWKDSRILMDDLSLLRQLGVVPAP